jgi:hypothetical protein
MEYLYFVHLSVPDEATSFEDNYFDVEPGESRTSSSPTREEP